MKRFSCGDVVPNCRARFEGASEADVLAKIARHASEDHGMTSISDDMLQTVRRHIVDYSDAPNG
jgi:predicted small metal-binding protein